jgi:hypothetical protein
MMIGLGAEYDPETGMELYATTSPVEIYAPGSTDLGLTSQYEYEEQAALQQQEQAIEQLEWDPSLDTVPPGTTIAQFQKQAAAVTALTAATAAAKAAAAKVSATKATTTARTQVVACKSGVDASGKCKDYVPGLSNSWLVGGAGIFAMLMIVLAMGGRR